MMKKVADTQSDIGRINFRLLHYFRVVAQELSFSQAALRLNMSQPPLSLHIKELENRLETQLFIRTTRSVELTLAGRTLLRDVEVILDQANNSLQQVRQLGRGEAGNMIVGIVGTAAWGGLLPVLRQLTARVPGITWSLNELTPTQQIDALHKRLIDIGIWRETYSGLPTDMASQLLGRENIALAVPLDHPLAGMAEVEFKSLKHENFILLLAQQSNLGNYLYSLCRRYNFTPNIVHLVNEPQTALALVADGYGITLVPEGYGRIGWPRIHFCRLVPEIPADLYAIYDPLSVTPVAQAFLDILQTSITDKIC